MLPRSHRLVVAASVLAVSILGVPPAVLASSPPRVPGGRAAGYAAAARAGETTAYQIDPRHDGYQAVGLLRPRGLGKKWSRTLGHPATGYDAALVTYPLVAGGRVFVAVEGPEYSTAILYSLSGRTGKTDWSAGLGGREGFAGMAYDNGRVFVVSHFGVLTAYAAETGQKLWAVQMPGESAFNAPPTAYQGVVYVTGAGYGGRVYGVSESHGRVLWQRSVENGDQSSPAVGSTGVYLSFRCQQDYRFSLRGARIWHHAGPCEGGGGSTPALHGGAVYARGSHDPPLILSAATGQVTGSFTAGTIPAFSGRTMYTLRSGKIAAVAASGGPRRWTSNVGGLVTAPVVNNGVVYAGAANGKVYGLSSRTGKRVWTGTAGSMIIPSGENKVILVGIAIGDGLLVVPAGAKLTAFAN